MQYNLKAPDRLQATVTLPASKSISNRVSILSALTPEAAPLINLADSDDGRALQHALRSADETVDIGAAGTAMRFLTAYFAARPGRTRLLTGSARMRQRPIGLLVDALRGLGADITYTEREGYPPLRIVGQRLRGGEVTMDSGVSSQFLSALLMVAPTMERGLQLRLTGATVSETYLRMTVGLMRRFGVVVEEADGGRTFRVAPQPIRAVPFTVEADWSAASYWYEMVALARDTTATVELLGLTPDSLQGDAAIAALFERLGVRTTFTDRGLRLDRLPSHHQPERFTCDCVLIPDMAQTLVVTCAALGLPFRFDGLQSLRIKETDRLAALQTELHRFGFVLTEHDGRTLQWDGTRCPPEATPTVATYDDHRMAMAFAPLALVRPGGVTIAHPEVVTKSYLRFWDDLRAAGFRF